VARLFVFTLSNSPHLSLQYLHRRICGRKTGSHFSCKCSEPKAPPASSRSCAGKHVVPFPFSASRPSERGDGAPRRRNISGASIGMPRTPGEACRTLSGECSPLGAPSRRCFASRAARLGVHVRLAPTRACERIANRSLCRWADPRDTREPELRCLKPAGAAVPAPPPDASPETTTPLERSGNGKSVAQDRPSCKNKQRTMWTTDRCRIAVNPSEQRTGLVWRPNLTRRRRSMAQSNVVALRGAAPRPRRARPAAPATARPVRRSSASARARGRAPRS
jgi:hypothetical protein